ncbi:archaea-specific SMC-related protein [Natrarchaeobius oligotrophus]|uniref:Chromosome segregation protein SMC n=1 Tax=Natrarchaeobius chitinivorans TaxID=1679083 RepID=A0A3N6MSG9_NATCH|nr:archaea-specific SMC-related protein [Natrarchaeobius chitinivorans]RQG99241.1 chromosome segregation protein SMC [Natrarchaeobius chitinivorans]
MTDNQMAGQNEQGNRRATSATDTAIAVENIGGIDAVDLTFSRGVTLLTGQNATNRTSLLRALAGGLGGSASVLKRDADAGRVALTIGGETYERRHERTGAGVRTDGNPYTDADQLVDLFVCLLEDNPIRRAVRADDDLSDHLLAPVDTDELERKIVELRSERDGVDERLNEIERERTRLPKLEERRTDLRTQRDELRSELEDVRSRIDATEANATESDHVESILEEIDSTQTRLAETESELETQRTIRDELANDLDEVRASLADLEVPDERLSELEREMDRLRGRESELSTTINELSTILTQNRQVLDGDGSIVSELAVADEPASRLDPRRQSIECWTCGSDVNRGAIGDRLEDIERLVETKRSEREQVRERLAELRSRRESIEQTADRRQELRTNKAELERELEARGDNIAELTSRADALRGEIEELRSNLEAADTDDDLADYERLSELEYERGQIDRQLRELEDEINEIEYRLSKSDDLEARRDDLADRITSLRSRVDDLERDVVETFNEHMGDVLDLLDYENVARVWIERRTDGEETSFDLHIVRTDDDGTAYEDDVSHLSESEREVVGFVVALAGYLTHEVSDVVPMILLDSVEAIDASRIAALVEYVEDYTEYLVLALLEEDAAALPEEYDRVYATESLS